MEPILAIDVGAGTQDILLYDPSQPVENNVKLVLPSWTRILAGRIEEATEAGRPVYLTGETMGGGPLASAAKRHVRAGYAIYATPDAARSIRDNLDEVRARGVTIVEDPPDVPDLLILETKDVDLKALAQGLATFGVLLPERVAIAVQDHGGDTGESQRRSRFRIWEHFLYEQGGKLEQLLYTEPPCHLTRMCAVQRYVPDALLMDTGAAAVWGILEDPVAAEHREAGFVAVNVGNQHTLGTLVRGDRILGLFEFHTALCTPAMLSALVDGLRTGILGNDAVRERGGHGAAYAREHAFEPGAYDFVAVTGPRRAMAEGLGYAMAAPYGDMMLTGCFGMVAAIRNRGKLEF